jgi:hypothetical protein
MTSRTQILKADIGRRINTLLARLSVRLGISLETPTSMQEVHALISKLRPLDCGMELIRIGGPGDGGYLIPDDLVGLEYCFSPGVSETSDFEAHLATLKIKSFLADYSVDSPPISRPEFTFDKKFVGATDHEPFFTLASWKDKYLRGYSGGLLLQMDIEGNEYGVLLNTTDQLLAQFRILVIEFHFLDRLFDRFCFDIVSSCFTKILDSFYVAHIHPNNSRGSVRKGDVEVPRVMEFTFINKRRVGSTKPQTVFPHRLDMPNIPARDLVLPRCWYSD